MLRLPDADARWMLEEPDSIRLQQMHPALWTNPREKCLTCQFETKPVPDKSFQWWNPERTESVRWACNCRAQWIMHRFLLAHGIGKAYQRLSWADAVDVSASAQYEAMNYLEHCTAYVERGVNVIFHSPDAGSGKTLMAMLMSKGLLQRGVDAFVAQMNTIVDMYTSGWRSPEEREHFERRIMNCTVLVIDDLGKETGDHRIDFIDRLLDRVIRHRAAHQLTTVITSNLTVEQIRSGYGLYVMSLLTESCKFVDTSGVDWRPRARARTDDEIRLGLTRPLVML